MTQVKQSYGICIKNNTKITPIAKNSQNNDNFLEQGALLKIIKKNLNNKNIIQVFIGIDKWDRQLFFCAENSILEIDNKIWPYLINAKNSEGHTLIVNNSKKILKLTTNKKIGIHFNQKIVDCNIEYIGAVEEIDCGIFFGCRSLVSFNLYFIFFFFFEFSGQ